MSLSERRSRRRVTNRNTPHSDDSTTKKTHTEIARETCIGAKCCMGDPCWRAGDGLQEG